MKTTDTTSTSLAKQLGRRMADAVDRATVDSVGNWRIRRFEVSCHHPLSETVAWEAPESLVYSVKPNSDTEVLGVGCAISIEERDMKRVRRRMVELDFPKAVSWFGAFPFDAWQVNAGIWRGWPPGLWMVPRLTLRRRAGENIVHCTIVSERTWNRVDGHDWLETCLLPLVAQAATSSSAWLRQAGAIAEERHFSQLVDRALDAIHSGRFDKVVLARQSPMRVQQPLSEVLARLVKQSTTAHVFALHWHEDWFLGASPEELARVEEGQIFVDCLAGSTRRGRTSIEDLALSRELLESAKNKAEHGAVVDFVTGRLRAFATDVSYPPQPGLKRLPTVQHLHTPVTATLRPGIHLLEVAASLHPTPAIAGLPRQPALDFIEREEGWNRGYYAGGVGLLNGRGDGLLSVALRTALVRYPDALLFAGCGIVDGSVGEDEWRETELKLAPMKSALS
ncbi:MAG: isochorismate synthase [Firmicutes bacterium]|nr:isochorismate synthase [Bacillota bacterium]